MARKKPPPRGPQLELAGDLSVAFVNTAGARANNRQQAATTYAEWLDWGVTAGVVSPGEAAQLTDLARRDPQAAAASGENAAAMRSALGRIFLAVAGQGPLPPEDLSILNRALGEAMSAGRLVEGEQGIAWSWGSGDNPFDRIFWPVLASAKELLLSLRGRPHVRQCAARECLLFFVDRSPSGQRKWCEMKTCGHRASSLRYYHRYEKAARQRAKSHKSWSLE